MIINKWCIRRTHDNHHEINKWFSEKVKRRYFNRTDYHPPFRSNSGYWEYMHYPPKGSKHVMKKQKGYTEITFDEFRKYIINGNKTFIKSKWNKPEVLFIIREKMDDENVES